MKRLRNAILRSFIIYFLGLSVTVGLIEELFSCFLTLSNFDSFNTFILITSGLLEVGAICIFSLLFYQGLNKEISKEQQELVKRQTILFANIAHDLKTPLTSIRGFSKALNEGIVQASEKKEVLNIIHHKSITADELLDLMFQYTKLNTSNFALNLQDHDINYLLKETVAENYDLIEKYNVKLDLCLSEKPIFRKIDRLEMKRVFTNLLINACKHNPDFTKIQVLLEKNREDIRIIFADDGNDIPEKDRERLFEPFVIEDENERNIKGNGLGLAITKSIVEKHGFTIDLTDSFDCYTKKFIITI